ncbi:ComEC/Rec2 family competence protein [Litoribrevibacter albus]|uniref:MBL fold hydrolase n=1 Tax=Litoribrevibacter albus TaxID=1473156 RepID=A0AA37W673_9GAMM|nr:MBL fold metallo-hydrolase [Litoribrevibacter albus]GLQ31375.1 MBL fold hydrolase [Litoribrevibacter albus]
MELIITSFEAKYGDAFLIEEHDSNIRFLVDCGFKLTYKHHIKKRINSVDFIILTHSDEDHINGVFPLINDYPEKFTLNKIYVNSPESIQVPRTNGVISIRQAKDLINLLQDKELPFGGLMQGQTIRASKNLSLDIISPTKTELDSYYKKYNSEVADVPQNTKGTNISLNSATKSVAEWANQPDSFPKKSDDIANASSIAFILNFRDKKILFLADSHPEVISDYLLKQGFSSKQKATFDYIKLSHHGSSKSISKQLLSMISCNNFIISTNGGKAKSKHPSVETIAKLATLVDRNSNEEINFYFNHSISAIETRNGPLLSAEERLLYKINYIEQNEIRIT